MTKPTIDFDHHSREYRDGWKTMAAELHAQGSIGWTEAHGGYWVIADHAAIHRVASDPETFTSENDLTGSGNGGRGQLIPRVTYRLFLGESDPPLHTERRRVEAPFFTPKALREWTPAVRRHLDEALDKVIESGHADLVEDIAIPTAARTTLHVLGYDPNDWQDAANAAHRAAFLLPDHPDFPHEERDRMRGRFREMILERREHPTGDLITALAHGHTSQGELTLDEAESMMNALVFGGFATTVALLSHATIWLDSHPEERNRIATDEAFRKVAIEELLRFFPPSSGIARTALTDVEVLGQQIRAGESVYLWLAAGNRDPKVFPNPDVIDLERPNARENVSFSAGNHRCLGSPLAKVEISESLRILAERLPDLHVHVDEAEMYPSFGTVQGFSRIPISFTPGARVGASEPELAGV